MFHHVKDGSCYLIPVFAELDLSGPIQNIRPVFIADEGEVVGHKYVGVGSEHAFTGDAKELLVALSDLKLELDEDGFRGEPSYPVYEFGGPL